MQEIYSGFRIAKPVLDRNEPFTDEECVLLVEWAVKEIRSLGQFPQVFALCTLEDMIQDIIVKVYRYDAINRYDSKMSSKHLYIHKMCYRYLIDKLKCYVIGKKKVSVWVKGDDGAYQVEKDVLAPVDMDSIYEDKDTFYGVKAHDVVSEVKQNSLNDLFDRIERDLESFGEDTRYVNEFGEYLSMDKVFALVRREYSYAEIGRMFTNIEGKCLAGSRVSYMFNKIREYILDTYKLGDV